MVWTPVRTLEETEAILCAPGHLHEVETVFLDGRPQRIYKNLWPSMRSLWLSSVKKYRHKIYLVSGDRRYTYNEVHQRDRVGICSRNNPEYLISFWASHLLGAVPVLTNAWLPLEPLRHCLSHTGCKLILLDPERADRLAPAVFDLLRDTPATGFLVFDDQDNTEHGWQGMSSFYSALENYHGGTADVLAVDPQIMPEDNATIMFTSGTTGFPKGVLSTQRQFLSNIPNVMVGSMRASLRKGEDYSVFDKDEEPQKGILVAVPLFHVTGTTSFSMMATATGMKIVLASKWIVEDAVRLIKQENVRVAGGVPAMVADLTESSLAGHSLDGLLFGGSPAPDSLVPRARAAFPTAVMIQGYGLTETNSIAVSFAGEDYTVRPTSTGRASPVNEIKIVHNGLVMSPGNVGEVWLRGPNVMKCYWCEPVATEKVITLDGWLKTGDLGFLDEEGFLYIKDRLKDIIIRGGENIDSVSVENALYRDSRILEAAAVGVPDDRLGELVAAVVSVKSAYRGSVTEASLIRLAKKYLPRFAVPVMIVVFNEPLEHTPSGKIIKGELRQIARQHWEARRRNGTARAREPLANL
ncbi:2-succinylbenzoate--CoA ligase [Termitomyces sp. J132]|nr:2-succinylbenzoate--CoA ligase [Termitomyces sp. J132]